MVPPQLFRGDRRNHHREVGFICVVSVYRALCRTTGEGCPSGGLADRTHQGLLVVSDRAEHEDEVRLADPCLLQSLLGGLTTCYVGIMVVAHADSGFGSHGPTPPACQDHLSLEGLCGIPQTHSFSP